MTSMPQSYPGRAAPMQHGGSDRSSRSSSMSTDAVRRIANAYDFNAPVHVGYPHAQNIGYEDMVFPERGHY